MNEHFQNATQSALEERSRELFEESVGRLDMRMLSRLTQARHAALDAAAAARRRPWLFHPRVWTPAAGVTAAAVLGAVLWLGLPGGNHGMTAADLQPGFEDLDIVASSDEDDGVRGGDAMEMLQNDLDFYDFADKAASPGPAA
jgi:hypothetical protein